MKIYSASQIRKADAFTIKNEPISSIDLMERAATSAFNWINKKYTKKTVFSIFCGVGNNGGDGLVIARLLHQSGYTVQVYEVQFSPNSSKDYLLNKERLQDIKIPMTNINSGSNFSLIQYGNVIIDTIFGSGLTRPINGWIADLVEKLNGSNSTKIAIDIASGIFVEDNGLNNGVVLKPAYTLTFEFPKLAFMFPENASYVGNLVVLPIGISKDFIVNEPANYFTIEKFTAKLIHKKSNKYDYKGTYGHALIMAGSYGKMGAAVLATKACLKTGTGLVTAQIPRTGNDIMQISVPEAMTWPDSNELFLTEFNAVSGFNAIGIGPGLGQELESGVLLKQVLKGCQKPMVLDADALNLISNNNELWNYVPQNSIVTPHLGEWSRLIGKKLSGLERLKSAKGFSNKNQIIVVLKGANTAIVCPDGEVFFNTTGNPGMATAGSGDVLTGILTSLLSQGYQPKQAAILGVYIHGVAGDIALEKGSRESVTSGDIIDNLGLAFQTL